MLLFGKSHKYNHADFTVLLVFSDILFIDVVKFQRGIILYVIILNENVEVLEILDNFTCNCITRGFSFENV